MIARATLIALCLGITWAAWVMAGAGVWGESPDAGRSLRLGSPGGGYGSDGRIK